MDSLGRNYIQTSINTVDNNHEYLLSLTQGHKHMEVSLRKSCQSSSNYPQGNLSKQDVNLTSFQPVWPQGDITIHFISQ